MRKKHSFKGDEFVKGEIALLEGKYPVTVIAWTKPYGGWWYIKLQNGCFHYTQLLTKISKNAESYEKNTS